MNTMNNILFKIFLLLVLALGWGSSAWAVTTITPSDAPTNGQFAANTQWYTIVYRGSNANGTYLNVGQNTDSELTWGSNTLDKGAYWCFVGDDTSGFKMYNLKSGATMVLQAVSDADNAHVKMVAATAADENLSLFTTGAMTANGKTSYNYIRRGTSGNAGFNNNSNYVAMYKHPSNLTAGANFAVEITAVTLPDNGSYRVVIQNDNNYTVTTTATASISSQSAKNGGTLELPENLDLKDLRSFTIDCTDKFVYGPVIDKGEKTVTYTISNPETSLTEGWYQMQVVTGNSVNTKIAARNTNINTQSANIYAMAMVDECCDTGNNYWGMKYSGVPAYAKEASTFVYLKANSNTATQILLPTGHYMQDDGCTNREAVNVTTRFSNYKLAAKRWVESGRNDWDEAPAAAASDNYPREMVLRKIDISQYSVYKVEIDDWVAAANTYQDPTVTIKTASKAAAQNRGLSKVYQNGYFFFERDYVPTVEDFEVQGVDFVEMTMKIEGADEIKTLHFTESSATEGYRIIINGDSGYTVSTTADVKSGQKSAPNGGYLDLAVAPTANDLRSITIDCTDKFVWGPAIDNTKKTITYDIRDLATSLTAGRWYQIQILDRRGKYTGNNWYNDYYNTLNNASTITKKSNTLYVMNYPSLTMNTYPSEVSGVPVPEQEPYWSYVYIADVDASNNIAWQRPNGRYIKNTGQDNGTTLTRSWALTYQSADKSFAWNGGIMPWNDLGDNGSKHLALGYTGNGTQTGTFQSFIHPVSFGDDYDIYKIDSPEGNLTYTGSANCYVATGGAISSSKVAKTGQYMFFPKGFTLNPADFTLSGAVSLVLTPSDAVGADGAKTLTVTPSFGALGTSVNLVFKNGQNNSEMADGSVWYTNPQTSKRVLLTSADSPYNFDNVGYRQSLFTSCGANILQNVALTEADGQQTLTFTIVKDFNQIQTSSEPNDAGWSANTHWFTIHNNRNNKGYLSTQDAGSYLDAQGTITIKNGADARGDRGGLWAFVEKEDGGINIYNNAYGPDFILGISGSGSSARLQMYPKDAVPGGVSTLFAYGENSTRDGGASHAYYFNIGLTGNNHLNEQSGYAGTWAPSGTQKTTDPGSAFTVTAIEDAHIETLPAYDVYKVEGYDDVVYIGERPVFGRRKEAPYIILSALAADGTEITEAELRIPGGREVEEVVVTPADQNPNSSYIKILRVSITKYYLADAGWYQMTITPNGSPSPHYVVYNSSTEKYNASNGYPLSVAATDVLRAEYSSDYKCDARQWVYVSCDKNTGKWIMQALDGHYLNAEMQAVKTEDEPFDFVYRVKPIAEGSKHYAGSTYGINVASGSLYLGGGESDRQAQFHPVVLTARQHGASMPVYAEPAASTRAQRVAPESTANYDIWKVVNITGGNDPATDVTNATRVTCLNKNNAGLTKVYKNGYFVFPVGTTVNASDFTIGAYHTTADADLPAGADKALTGVTPGGSGNTATFAKDGVTVTITLNPTNKEITVGLAVNAQIPILSRTSYYVDNSTEPEGNHLVTKNDGWKTGGDGKLVQNASEFRIVNYVAPGKKRIAVLPTVMVQSGGMQNTVLTEQRWYNYADGGATPIPNGINFWNSGTNYKNGKIYRVNNTFYYSMPSTGETYSIAGDLTRWVDKVDYFVAGETYAGVKRSDPNGREGIADGTICRLEPTIGMRAIYEFHSAYEMANRLNNFKGKTPGKPTSVDGTDQWLEGIMHVSMPSISTTITNDVLPLGLPVQNYWISPDGTLKNTDAAYRTGDSGGGAKIVVELDANGTGITLGRSYSYVNEKNRTDGDCNANVTKDMLSEGLFYDGSPNGNNISVTGRPRYVEFEYPSTNLTSDSRRQVNMEGLKQKTAYINVYLKDEASGEHYRIKRFEITFTAGSEMRHADELEQLRDASYMRQNYEKATELVFGMDRKDYTSPSDDMNSSYNYATPLKFSEMSYAYTTNSNQAPNGGNSYGPNTSEARKNGQRWGEYSLYNEMSLSGVTYKPVSASNYFIYVDTAELPGNIATLSMNGNICTNSTINVSMYMASGCEYKTYQNQVPQGQNNGASIILRVWGVTKGGSRYNIYNYCPGQVGAYIGRNSGNSSKRGWQQLFFSFQPSVLKFANESDVKNVSYDRFEIELVNNCMSSQGGDFVLSDLEVFINKPNARAESVSPLCGHEIDAIKLVSDYENLLKASNVVEVEDANIAHAKEYSGVYCFLDKDIFDKYLKDHETDIIEVAKRVNNAFDAALVGRSATGSDVTDPFHLIKYWDCYSKHEDYNYSKLANPSEPVLTEAMKNNNNQIRQLVFNARVIDHNSSEEFNQLQAGHTYILAFGVLSDAELAEYNARGTEDARKAYLSQHCTGMFYKLDDVDCAVTSTFTIQPAYRLVIDGDDQGNSSPTLKNFCTGQVPSIQVKNTEYTAKGEVQDRAEILHYDWYSGSLESYYRQVPNAAEAEAIGMTAEGVDPLNETFKLNPGSSDRLFCLDEVLLVFRSHFPDAVDLEGNKSDGTKYDDLPLADEEGKRVKTDPDVQAYTLTMQNYLQQYVEFPNGDLSKTPKLRMSRQQVQLNLADTPLGEVAALVAVPTDRREGFTRFDSGTLSLNCYEPQEVSFVPSTPAPSTIIGHGELDSHYPSLLNSIPLRMTQSQAEAISKGHKLQIPLRKLNTSGFFDKIIYEEPESAPEHSQQQSTKRRANAMSKILKNIKSNHFVSILEKVKGDKKDKNFTVETTPVNFEVDAMRSDLVIIETNDPQWQMNLVNEDGDTFLPYVGSLRQINAGTANDRNVADNSVVIQFNTIDLGGTLNGDAMPDAEGVTYTFKTDVNGRYCYPDKSLTVSGEGNQAKNVQHKAYREFVPREGYYYILRGSFMESKDESAGVDEGEGYVDEHCPGTLIIPIKVVPEYMKWTGAVNSDWNNDRNWARADRSDLVTVTADADMEGEDVQNFPTSENPQGAYSDYLYNEYTHRGRHKDGEGNIIKELNGVVKATNDDGQPYVAYAETRENVFTRTGADPNYQYAVEVITKYYRGTNGASAPYYDSEQEVCCLYNNKTLQREYYNLGKVTIANGVVTQIDSKPVTDPTLYRICAPLSENYTNYKGELPDDLEWNGNRASTGVNVSYTPCEGKSIYLPIDYAEGAMKGTTTYAPMKSTRVIIPAVQAPAHVPVLTVAGIRNHLDDDPYEILDLGATTTPNIEYDMPVRTPDNPNDPEAVYTVEPYYENTVKDITFQPGARMMGSEYLTYQKAWVEYALDVNRWYTLASPLQDTYAGEWYAPTGTDASTAAKQLTPYFHDINYTTAHYDRFRPAIFQRSWDAASDYTKMWLKTGGDCNSYIANDWSEVYNNVLKRYDTGGFSVKVEIDEMSQKPGDNVAIVRMPKADTKYTYYDINGQTASKADDALPVLTNRYRLWTDKLAKSAEFQQTITNAEPGNNYFLVGNPFMTNLDMEAFFQANPQFEKTYWVLSYTDDQKVQSTSVRAAYDQRNADVAEDERWIVTASEGNFAADQAVVAPLQGFFVKTTAVTNTTTVNYTPAMQTLANPTFKELYSPQLPVIDGGEGDDPDAAPDVLPAEGPMYTISGLRVKHTDSKVPLSRGIYIQSGKKQLK